jgi:hypothetical protein
MKWLVIPVTVTLTIGLTLMVVTWIQTKVSVCEICDGMYVMASP